MQLASGQEFVLLLGYPLLGMAAGVIAGLLGVGGGLIIVPALIGLFTLQDMPEGLVVHAAVGTSLATIVATSLSSLRAHHAHGAIAWPWVRALAPGLAAGALGGAWLATAMEGVWLQRSFAVFALLVALQILLSVMPERGQDPTRPPYTPLAGALIGGISGIVGIGGGTMTVPFLVWRGMDMRRAVATSAACGLPIALAGMLGFMLLGPAATGGAGSTGYVQWPAALVISLFSVLLAPVGASLTHRLPIGILKRLFAVLLLVLGGKLLLG